MCSDRCRHWLCYLCSGTPGTVISVERASYSHSIWIVCGYSDAAVCAGVLAKETLDIYFGSHFGTRCGLFPGTVHAHRFSRGETQLVSHHSSGAELCRSFPKFNLEEKEWKRQMKR